MNIKIWNQFGDIDYEADSIWINQEWKLQGGRKYEYEYNQYNQVASQAWKSFDNINNDWNYSFKNIFSIFDEQTGEYDGALVYNWDENENKWQYFNRLSEVKIHNWNGFSYFVPEMEHVIMEAWTNEEWTYFKKDSIVYDTLGGKLWYYFTYYYDSNMWHKYFKQIDEYNEDGYQIKYYRQFWQNNEWVNHDGYIISYQFDGPRLMEVVKDEWDTISGSWIPFRKYLFDDYSYILKSGNTYKKENESLLKIIPNPSKQKILIKLSVKDDAIKTISIYGIDGKRLTDKTISGDEKQTKFDISYFKKGVYIINVSTKKGKIMKSKFVKE